MLRPRIIIHLLLRQNIEHKINSNIKNLHKQNHKKDIEIYTCTIYRYPDKTPVYQHPASVFPTWHSSEDKHRNVTEIHQAVVDMQEPNQNPMLTIAHWKKLYIYCLIL